MKGRTHFCLHFTDNEIEAEEVSVICLRSQLVSGKAKNLIQMVRLQRLCSVLLHPFILLLHNARGYNFYIWYRFMCFQCVNEVLSEFITWWMVIQSQDTDIMAGDARIGFLELSIELNKNKITYQKCLWTAILITAVLIMDRWTGEWFPKETLSFHMELWDLSAKSWVALQSCNSGSSFERAWELDFG